MAATKTDNPVIGDRVAIAARALPTLCATFGLANTHNRGRGGFARGAAAFAKGTLVAIQDGWLAEVEWDAGCYPCRTINIGNLIRVRDIAKDADRYVNSPVAAA